VDVETAGRPDRFWALETKDGVRDVEEVLDSQLGCGHSCLPRPKLHVEGVRIGKGNRPEQALGVGGDARVEVMNLGREVVEVILTSVEVQSDEPENSLVDRVVLADVDPAHESHVGIELEGLGAAVGIRCHAGALDVGHADKPVEVGNR